MATTRALAMDLLHKQVLMSSLIQKTTIYLISPTLEVECTTRDNQFREIHSLRPLRQILKPFIMNRKSLKMHPMLSVSSRARLKLTKNNSLYNLQLNRQAKNKTILIVSLENHNNKQITLNSILILLHSKRIFSNSM